MKVGPYVLITPARDEEEYIPALIESVLAQTLRPMLWVMVNDGSRDRTGDIINRFAKAHEFIVPVHAISPERNFGSKVKAFECGYQKLSGITYQFIGNLDADVTVPPNYYQQLVERMGRNTRLGAVSGATWDRSADGFTRLISSSIYAAGPSLFFSRKCFETIGGYIHVRAGGEDSIAVQMARFHGWETCEFEDLKVLHHKPTGAMAGNWFHRSKKDGMTEYHIGTHPLFALAKAIRRIQEKPFLIGAVVRYSQYFKLWISGEERDVSPELVRYLAVEQISRLKQFLREGTL